MTTLSPLFTDHAVLQAELPIAVFGEDTPGTRVQVTLADKSAAAAADEDGHWICRLPALPHGGPHTLAVTGSKEVTRQDILVGEVCPLTTEGLE
ncbi:MAG: hypothetical protein ACYTGH_18830 [Planctomycetota bacterium]|jgi:sialate O-acetylesterase